MSLSHSVTITRTASLALVAGGALLLAACGSPGGGGSAGGSGAGGAASSAPAGSGACALLTMAEAQAAFLHVTQAKPYTDLEKVGIQACDFGSAATPRVFQTRLSKSTVEDEMATFETGVMDPAKQAHLKRDPFGAGGEAIVSEQGKTPGALGDIGVAALQKGATTVVVSTGTIVGGGEAAEKKLIALVTAAAGRAP